MGAKCKKIEFVIDNNGCFVCISHGINNRYPRILDCGKVIQMSRFIYTECFGEIPENMDVCHNCDNTHCINPEHFFLGTHQDNMIDRANKGRNACGEKILRAKLTTKDINYIRANVFKLTNKELSEMFGINDGNMSRIRTFKTWKHVKAPSINS